MKKFSFRVLAAIILWCATSAICTARTYQPNGTSSFTGANTYCQGTAANALTFTYTTCFAAGGAAGEACSISWYTNTTNSTATGTATLVSGPTAFTSAEAATGSQSYTPATTTAGSLYYFCVITITNAGCAGAAGTQITSSTTQLVAVNPTPTAVTVTGAGTFCGSATLDASNGGSGNIYYQGTTSGGTSTADFSTSQVVTTSGTYYFNAQSAGGCWGTQGSAAVVINPIPNVYTVSGGGSYCAGGTGEDVQLSSSDVTTTYQLYNGSTATGAALTGGTTPLDFGSQTAAGTYTVLATEGTCTAAMNSDATVIVDPLPQVYNVSGGGGYCPGSAGEYIDLSYSDVGINYQLYNGSTPMGAAQAGATSSLSFGPETAVGTYTVLATNMITTCTNNMNGSAVVTALPAPMQFTLSGAAGYCQGGTGVDLTLSGSVAGTTYQLYDGATAVGTPMNGGGGTVDFGNQLVAGTYSVLATITATGCTGAMTNSTSFVVYPLPNVYSVGGGGSYCMGGTGVDVTLSGYDAGVDYQLYNGSATVGAPVPGAGATPLDMGVQTAAGTYTVLATNTTTGCTNNMSASATVSINPLPTIFAMTGGGGYCAGGTGSDVGLSGSQTGVNYELYNGATFVTTMAGTNNPLDFGLETATGNYTIVAVNATTLCTGNMSGTATVSINPLPNAYTVSGGGSYCAGGTGVDVQLSASDVATTYQLYDGSTAEGTPLTGGASPLDFGLQTAAGTYTVSATTTSTGCMNSMSGSATIVIDPLPQVYPVSGGGNYCSGGTGEYINLGYSDIGINYQLYNGSTAVGAALPGGSSSLAFGPETAAGTYTVLATNTTTTCTSNMSGSATITILPLPAQFNLAGAAGYCQGGTGVDLTLSGSVVGTTYQLYDGATAVGTPMSGGGGTVDFGNQLVAGTYSVLATITATGCTDGMNNSTSFVVYPLPNVYSVGGGGSYCMGGTGVDITLSGYDAGVDYQLYNGSATVGAPVPGAGATPLDMGVQTAAGTYTVLATNTTTGCTNNMSASATVSINPLPAVFAMEGGGSYCAGGTGVHVKLSGSENGVNYELYNGTTFVTTLAGTGTVLHFGLQTAAGTYTVQAYNATTLCTSAMSGTATVSINPLPSVYTVSGGGSYCAGGTGEDVQLSASDAATTYQLYDGSTTEGTPLTGGATPLDFGLQTAAGIYTVMATTTATGCNSNMNGSATVIVEPLPQVYVVSGGGSYCSGSTGEYVDLSYSDIGVNYQLYNGSTAVGTALPGALTSLSFGPETAAGVYTVFATNTTTGCTNNMSGSATVNILPAPTQFNVTGAAGYCQGDTGVTISLSGSVMGTTYQLYDGATAVDTSVTGTGSALSFGNQLIAGTYSVLATITATGCTGGMANSTSFVVYPLPNVYAVGGGGSYCMGGAGVEITLSGYDAGVNYQLYYDTTAVGAPVPGAGATPLDMGVEAAAGSYTVFATNTTTGCTNNMSGSATVSINPLPALFAMTGGGGYCVGNLGVHVGLSGSEIGVNYELYEGATLVTTMAGTGNPLDFGLQTVAGNYTVVADNATTLCTSSMIGTAIVSINPLPNVYTVSGGGSYCAGGIGVDIQLSGSDAGIDYQLYDSTTASGSPLLGTGAAPFDLGLQTAAGTYTVLATNPATLCISNMLGSAGVTVNALPAIYSVTGGGAYCAGSGGSDIGLNGSQIGVNYQLYDGATLETTLAGTGAILDFGLQAAAGTYTVVATNATTLCTSDMNGSASVTVNALPMQYTLSAGGSFCAGGTGIDLTLTGSDIGVSYQLYNGSTPVGSPLAGTGAAPFDLGIQSTAGSYSVLATNTTTYCTNDMLGTSVIVVNPLPTVFNVTGNGSYCAGGTGIDVGLSGSTMGISYELYNGSALVTTVVGTGNPLDFGFQTAAGTYTVLATNTVTFCTNDMAGGATVVVNPLPTVYNVTGGGTYCAGGTGEDVSLSGSDLGINYELYDGATYVSTLAGTGSPLDFGIQTVGGTYAVVATNATTGCTVGMNGNATITVNPIPTAYDVTGGGTSCGTHGFPVGLSNSDIGINYQLYVNGSPIGGSMAGIGSALDFGLFVTPGSYMVIATNGTTGCVALMADSAVIVINPLPAAISGNTSICVGDTTTLADATTGGTWSSNNTSVATIDMGLGTMTGVTGGMTTITYTLPTTCYITAPVTVNALPVVPAITGVTNECAGAGNTLADATAGGVWSSTNTSVATIDPAAGTVSGLVPGIVTISYTVTNSFGCIASVATPDTVNALPVVDAISGAGSICLGATATLADDSTGGVWTSGNTSVATIDPSLGSLNGVSAGTATISYTVTNASGCVTTVTANETINPLPVVGSINGTAGVCVGFTISLSDTSMGGMWSSSNTAAATIDASGTVTAVAAGNTTISYTVTNMSGCTSTVTFAVAIGNAIPATVILPAGEQTLCNNTPINLVLSPAGTGVAYQWLLDGNSISGATNGSYITDTTGIFSVIIGNGVCSETIGGTTIIPPPNPVISYNSSGNYLFTGSYASYQWYKNGSPVPGATTSILVLTGAGTYKVVVGDANGCYVTSANYDFTGSGGGGGGGGTSGVSNTSTTTDVKVFPNPATSTLQIIAPVSVNVSIISPDGKLVLQQNQATNVDVSGLADGLYIIMIYDENNNLLRTDKFAKIK